MCNIVHQHFGVTRMQKASSDLNETEYGLLLPKKFENSCSKEKPDKLLLEKCNAKKNMPGLQAVGNNVLQMTLFYSVRN